MWSQAQASGGDVTARPVRHRRPGAAGRFAPWSFTIVCVVALAVSVAPSAWAMPLMFLTVFGLIVALGTGPLLRGARPMRVWVGVPVGAAFLVAALAARPFRISLGPVFTVSDLFYTLGYATLGLWLAALIWHVGRGGACEIFLDTAAAAIGAFLALWSIGAVHGQLHLDASVLAWALYPILDVVALALSANLALRLEHRVPAWRFVITGMVLQLGLDLVHAVNTLAHPVTPLPEMQVMYLFTYWALAAGAAHPTIAELSWRPATERPALEQPLRPVLILIAILPAIATLVAPIPIWAGGIVRRALISALLVLLLARLLATMTALARAERVSRHEASHDPLTGLLNRGALDGSLSERLARDELEGMCTAVLFIDCDDFKHVNDTWGHPAGDRLLRAIAAGLPPRLDDGDVMARQGGDEFVVMASVVDEEAALRVADTVIDFFRHPLPVLEDRRHTMTPSIGVAVAQPGAEPSAVGLLEKADAALYEAKAAGRGRYVLFDSELEARGRTRAAISDALRSAIAEERIEVALQPIYAGPPYQRLAGWEALARWTDPRLGVVPPSVFVPMAEAHGLIESLGTAVLRRACRDAVRLREEFGPGVTVSVNVSPVQLRNPRFVDIVIDALAAAGLSGDALWLEVTESALVDTGESTLATMNAIRAAGVRFSVDDLGTGYWSLTNLLQLPVDCIKLDRSVVQRIGVEPGADRQIRALLELFRSMDLPRVIAEGVETEEMEAELIRIGCPLVQGWLYGRPEPVATILRGRSTGVENSLRANAG